MELGKQIKSYRDRDGLSQEKLAEKIYVSRQSISNWENEKSYPDIHNLLQLSEVFQVSLDELIKGDVDMMRNEVESSGERKEMYFWGKGMIIGLGLMVLTLGPATRLLGMIGLIVPGVFGLVGIISSIQAERLKRKNNIKTYEDILAYMDGKESSIDKKNNREKFSTLRNILFILGCAAAGFCVVIVIIKMFFV